MHRRFVLALILAILPFAVLAAGQAAWRLLRAEDQSREDLLEAARTASSHESIIIARAEAVLGALSNLREVREGGESCDGILYGALAGSPYTNVARLDASGRIVCSSTPISGDTDRSQTAWWQRVLARGEFTISDQHLALSSGRTVITAALPLTTFDGKPDGALALGIPVDFLADSMRQRRLARDTVAALIDAGGNIVAASDMAVAQAIFASGSELSGGDLKEATDTSGEIWRYAVADVHENDLYVAFARRRSALLGWSYFDFAVNMLLPVMMAVFAFIAIWYAADRFVLRWIAYLQRIARTYGGGHLALRPVVDDAPAEIQQLAYAMGDMADNVRARDQRLRQALEQRMQMAREIHHRVKNNLQIVSSLLQIESRRLQDPASREALRVTHTRVNAIALVHRVLEEIGDRTVVNARTLLNDLARLLSDAFGAEYGPERITVEAPDLFLDTDAAVPLALYLVEQVADVYAHARAAKRKRADVRLVLSYDAASGFKLELGCEGEDCMDEPPKGPNFVSAYARQLEGRLSRVCEGGRTNVSLDFGARWMVTPEASPPSD